MFNNIRHLRFVVSVARAKSLQQAAQELMISESAVSTAIKSVEEEVGYSIFVRRPARALTLTPAGRDFIAEAVAFLDQAEAFHSRVVGLGNDMTGTVRLAMGASFAAVVAPALLKAVRAEHPRLTIELTECELPELLTRLRNGDDDLALTYDLGQAPDIEMRRVLEVRPYVVVSSLSGARTGDMVSLRDLAERPLLMLDEPVASQYILQLFRNLGLEPKVAMYAKSIRLLGALVSEDFGYAVYFLRSARNERSDAPIARLHIEEPVPSHHLALALPRRRVSTARTEAVAEICEATLRAMGPSIAFR